MMGRKNTEERISTLIGKECELTGDFAAKGSARIDGKIDGNVMVDGNLILGAGGVINGNISAESVLLGGEVIGNVTTTQKVELTATAKVLGDISTKVIVIDEHAVFQGRCDMNQNVPERKNKVAKAVRVGRKTAKAAIAEALREVEEQENREIQNTAETVSEEKDFTQEKGVL